MKLKIHNYGIIEDLETELVPGLTVLVGQNGSGKSTFVDALYFAITGDTIDGRNVAERINWGALDGKSVVTLTADNFTVERTIKSTGVSHKLTTPTQTLTKKSDVNAMLYTTYNIDNDRVLKDVFFAAQLHATDLFDATDAARLAMLAKVFGLDKLETCRAAILKVLSDTTVPTVSPEILSAAETKVSLAKVNLENAHAEREQIQRQLDEMHFDVDGFHNIMSLPLDTEKDACKTRLRAATDWLEQNTSKLEELRVRITSYDDAYTYLKCLKDQKENEDSKAQVDAELKELVPGPSAQSFSKALSEALRRKSEIDVEINALRQRSSEKLTVCPLTQGSPCIELLRAHDPELVGEQLKEKQKLAEELENDIKQLEKFIEDQQTTAERRASLLATKKILDAYVAPEIKVPETLKDASIGDVEKFLESFEDIGTSRTDLQELERAAASAAQAQQINTEWLLQHADDKCTTKEERDRWEAAYLSYHTKTSELSRLDVQVDAYTATLKSDEATLAQLKAEQRRCEDFAHRCEILRTTRELLSKGQLQRALLKNTIEQLNKEVASCSKLLGFKYPLFINEDGSIRFVGEHGAEADVKALSGGQKYAAAIMLRLAFARVIQSTFPFVVLDEPSTCLDVQSRQLLASLLTALHDRNRQLGGILVVPTHDELLVSATDQVIQI